MTILIISRSSFLENVNFQEKIIFMNKFSNLNSILFSIQYPDSG